MNAMLRTATAADIPLLLTLIRELAVYERLEQTVQATEAGLHEALFGAHPVAEALLVEDGGQTAGFALWHATFSTFVGRPGLWLEDIFIRPAFRHHGLGKQVLGHLFDLARRRGYGRVEWTVLDWNEPAIRFYEGLGAKGMDDWRLFRLTL
jgi:GNAT superfamily N-acetyltransferase